MFFSTAKIKFHAKLPHFLCFCLSPVIKRETLNCSC